MLIIILQKFAAAFVEIFSWISSICFEAHHFGLGLDDNFARQSNLMIFFVYKPMLKSYNKIEYLAKLRFFIFSETTHFHRTVVSALISEDFELRLIINPSILPQMIRIAFLF